MQTAEQRTEGKNLLLLIGMIGCLCFGGGDWLMLYGDPEPVSQVLYWLNQGTAHIAPWRYSLALALSFPGIIAYGTALFSLERYIPEEKDRKIYHWLNIFGLTPWMALHLFYVMILYAFQFLTASGYVGAAAETAEAMFGQFSWFVIVSEAFMLPVFVWYFILLVTGRTLLKRCMAFCHVFPVYAVFYCIRLLLPVSAFRLGFTNGLMSESMFVFFLLLFLLDEKMRQ